MSTVIAYSTPEFALLGTDTYARTDFETIVSLRASKLAAVPREPGVYLILRESTEPPTFLEDTTGPDAPFPIAELRSRWVNDPLVYIGKAGGTGFKATLHSRLRAYLRHGEGRKAGHRGGRAIWQLADANTLLVAWKSTDDDPRDVERAMIAEFVARHGKRPFANGTG